VRQSKRELVIAVEGRRLNGTATLTRWADNTRHWRFEMSKLGASGRTTNIE
jgi:hypothetical protein